MSTATAPRAAGRPRAPQSAQPWIRFYPIPGMRHAAGPPVPSAPKRAWFSQHAYYCSPLLVANQYGWTVLNPHAWAVRWNGQEDLAALEVISPEGTIQSRFGSGILTVELAFLVVTSPGVDLLIKAVPNYPMDGLHPLEGIVETDWHDGIFTLNFRCTRAHEWVMRQAATPLAQLVPLPRGWLESFAVEWEAGTPDHAARVAAASPGHIGRGLDPMTKDGFYRRGKRRDGTPSGQLPVLKVPLGLLPGTTRPEAF